MHTAYEDISWRYDWEKAGHCTVTSESLLHQWRVSAQQVYLLHFSLLWFVDCSVRCCLVLAKGKVHTLITALSFFDCVALAVSSMICDSLVVIMCSSCSSVLSFTLSISWSFPTLHSSSDNLLCVAERHGKEKPVGMLRNTRIFAIVPSVKCWVILDGSASQHSNILAVHFRQAHLQVMTFLPQDSRAD